MTICSVSSWIFCLFTGGCSLPRDFPLTTQEIVDLYAKRMSIEQGFYSNLSLPRIGASPPLPTEKSSADPYSLPHQCLLPFIPSKVKGGKRF